MEQLTIRIAAESLESIEAEASERDVSKSEVAREWLRLGSEYESLQSECDRLQRRVEALISQRDEHRELVEYVDRERALQRRERERQDASLSQRARWWLFGYSPDETEG